jgi:hypothetical protein
MIASPKTYLLDGPEMTIPERRAARIIEMATILLEEPAYVERGDAVRCLHARGFNAIDIMMLVDDARHSVLQQIVAREMREP